MAKGSASSWEIGPPRDEDEALLYVDAFIQALVGERPSDPTWPTAWLDRTGRDNIRVVRKRGRILGGLALLRMGQFHGGRSVPMQGVSAVAIRPEHRASGAGSALLRAALAEARATRLPISALYPATQPVYRRLGYEMAGARTLYKIPCAALALRARSLDIRPIGPIDIARLRSAYLAFARRGAGLLDRSDWCWGRVLSAPDSTVYAYVAERAGALEGYVVFMQKPIAPHGYDIVVKDLIALTRDAAESLFSFLGDHRSMSPEVSLFAAPGDPLLMLLPEQSWKIDRRWEWMLRICDVGAAIEARGFPPGLAMQLQLEVVDEVIPENAGRWRLAIGGGHAEATRGGRGRVRVDARGLASLYSGRSSAHELARAGLVSGPDADLDALSAAFAGPAPWMPDMF